MPSNTKGGKGYKKKKKQAAVYEPVFIDRQEGQMPARAIRLLGNRTVLCFSNDNILRMCRICGKMKGRVFIEPGDVVLITLRDFATNPTAAELKKVKLGDIVGKYAPEQFPSLKTEEGVNPKIFMKLEVAGIAVAEIGTDYTDTEMKVVEDLGYDFENSESEESEEKEEKPGKEMRGSRQMAATRIVEDNDVNIDDI
jgi:translation initiation factor 1A